MYSVLLPHRMMWNDLEDSSVFSPIKGIKLLIDMIWLLVSWHLDCCPLDLNFVAKAEPRSSRTSGTGALSVLSFQLLSSLFTCQQLCPQAMSPHSGLLPCCLILHNYAEDNSVYMRVVAVLALNLGSGLFFKTENIGQSWCLCECLGPFITASHAIRLRTLFFYRQTHIDKTEASLSYLIIFIYLSNSVHCIL